MASIEKMKEKISKASEQHERTAQKLAELKARYEKEAKKLRDEMEKVNARWVTDFAAAAEDIGIQISLIDPKRLAELVKEHKLSLIIEDAKDSSMSYEQPKAANSPHTDDIANKLNIGLS